MNLWIYFIQFKYTTIKEITSVISSIPKESNKFLLIKCQKKKKANNALND